MRIRAVVAALGVGLVGCGESSKCTENACLLAGPSLDASVDAVAVPIDAPPECTDLDYEPNNSIPSAYQTSVGAVDSSITIPDLMICPVGDIDMFAVAITTSNSTLEMLIETRTGEPIVDGSLTNSVGVPLVNASPVAGMPQLRRAYLANLPSGLFYTSIRSKAGVSHYSLTLTVTEP